MVAEDFRSGQAGRGVQAPIAAPDQDSRTSQSDSDIHTIPAGAGHDQATTNYVSKSRHAMSSPHTSLNGQKCVDDQKIYAVEGSDQDRSAKMASRPTVASLADPQLALTADILDDLERTRIANENRLRQLTRDETDADGEDRGFGLTLDHPSVKRIAAIVDGLANLEHEATKHLQSRMREHPLGGWVKEQKGVGEKQAARLLAAIGDPYWNHLHDRPRTVSELWAYCGLHTVPVGQAAGATQNIPADGDSGTPGGDHCVINHHDMHVAARRKKGERANWSASAKMRAWNIAMSLVKAGIRNGEPVTGWGEIYVNRKKATEGRTHVAPCVRCGPSGKPAQPGSAWSDAHRHADALRILSKELLKRLWRVARDAHLGHRHA